MKVFSMRFAADLDLVIEWPAAPLLLRFIAAEEEGITLLLAEDLDALGVLVGELIGVIMETDRLGTDLSAIARLAGARCLRAFGSRFKATPLCMTLFLGRRFLVLFAGAAAGAIACEESSTTEDEEGGLRLRFRADRRSAGGHQGMMSSLGRCWVFSGGGPLSGNVKVGSSTTNPGIISIGDGDRVVTSSSPANTLARGFLSIFRRLKIP